MPKKFQPQVTSDIPPKPESAASYVPPTISPSHILKTVGFDNDRLTIPGPIGIWCYTEHMSYLPGETVRFHVSSSASSYDMDIARIGAKRETVWSKRGIKGKYHPTPDEAYAHGCSWPASFELKVPKDWRSGFYLVNLRATDRSGNVLAAEHFFVVRATNRGATAKILMVLSTNTYNAYNQFGGRCMYSSDEGALAPRLSFQRPWQKGLLFKVPNTARNINNGTPGFGEKPLLDGFRRTKELGYHHWTRGGGFHNWESIFVQWAEANGYTLDYCVQSDLDFHPEVVDGYPMITTVGHDEYWSWKERDVVDDFVANGGNAAFFIGNGAFWQVRLENSGNDMVCYKYIPEWDPVWGAKNEKTLTGMWSHPKTGRPENSTFGLSFTRGGYHREGFIMPRSAGGYMVYRPNHWVFAGTELEYGDVFGGKDKIVGYECDGLDYTVRNGLPYPTCTDGAPKTTEILALAPASLGERPTVDHPVVWGQRDLEAVTRQLEGKVTPALLEKYRYGTAAMITYTKGKSTVFNCGSTEWVYGLQGRDLFVERITSNILDRLSR